ncbi:hypothetical protein VT84_35520 [Gemmata sp. SH-PL17]|uniref:hypothetical protein n=1 Tax=Gemmata sp. SH-PL17 TaxID=1630693 RepID=UPI00078E0A60|nr:hypothetical protein [Gemmata sp. SH-PL17]AMV29757.1 hypothetical protein VT84_35520 [Gemmata sp. SH-PL17]
MDDTAPNTPPADSNGYTPQSSDSADGLEREAVALRARCSNLRHWCRAILEDPATAGVLDEATAAHIRSQTPEIMEAEGQTVLALLARGGNVPPTHPLRTKEEASSLGATIRALTAEHARLRRAFFALYDHLHPNDDLTDDYFLALRSQESVLSMRDALTEIEREFEGTP